MEWTCIESSLFFTSITILFLWPDIFQCVRSSATRCVILPQQTVSRQHICRAMKGILHVGRSDEHHTVRLYWVDQAIAALSLWMDSCECCLIELCCRIGCLCEAGPMPSCSIYCAEALKSIGKGSRFTKEEGLADNSCSIQAGLSMSTVSSVFHAHLQDNVPWAALAQSTHTTVNTLSNFLQSLCSPTLTHLLFNYSSTCWFPSSYSSSVFFF